VGVTRVNSTNVLDERLRIGEVQRQMNSKVNQSNKVYIESKRGVELSLLSICPSPSSPSPYIWVARSQGSGGVRYILQHRYTIWPCISTRITLGPSLTGFWVTQIMGSIIYTLVSSPRDSTRIVDSGWISNLHFFDLINLLTSSSCVQKINIFHYIISQGVLMNRPDNSDGSRGQLTTGVDTCHLLQIQSP
jgi:hypothetical protein